MGPRQQLDKIRWDLIEHELVHTTSIGIGRPIRATTTSEQQPQGREPIICFFRNSNSVHSTMVTLLDDGTANRPSLVHTIEHPKPSDTLSPRVNIRTPIA